MKTTACCHNMVAKTDRENPNSFLPLSMHLQDTAGVVRFLADEWLAGSTARSMGISRNELRKILVFLSMVHDIGKLSNAFQFKIMERLPQVQTIVAPLTLTKPETTEHAWSHHTLVGAGILHELGARDWVVSIVGAHHGSIMDQPDFDAIMKAERNLYGKAEDRPLWQSLWRECLEEALVQAGYASVDELPEKMSIPAQMLLIALTVTADWLSSNTAFFPLLDESNLQNENEMYPARIDRALKKMDFSERWLPGDAWQYQDLCYDRFGFDHSNAIQQAIVQAAGEAEHPGLYILEAPMGMGKTEAAFMAGEILANRWEESGLAFFLPSQATANAMFDRMMRWIAHFLSEESNWLEDDDAGGSGTLSIELAHGKALLHEKFAELAEKGEPLVTDGAEGLATNAFFMGRKTRLLANFVVGTVDQLLMAALNQKHLMLRHLGLAGKVVVVDEVHAYDAYMTRYMTGVLDWLGAYQTPVILLSATLPGARRTEMIGAYLGENNFSGWETLEKARDYPLLTWTDGQTVHTRKIEMEEQSTNVRILRGGEGDVVAFLRQHLGKGGCAGIIVNTVKRAQQLSEQLKRAFPAPQYEVILNHAQFIMPDRIHKEKQLMARLGRESTPAQRDGLIVVGTQVLEQSLDIDFDVMITDLCPMDLLLQRLGRLHRHRDRLRPSPVEDAACLVLETDALEEGAKAIYGEYLLAKTAAILPREIWLPTDISPLVQETYGDENELLWNKPAGFVRMQEEYNTHLKIQAQKANQTCIPKAKRKAGAGKSARRIDGLMHRQMEQSEEQAQASVRDGSASIEVLVLRYGDEALLHPAVEREENLCVSPNAMPSVEEAKIIMRQSLRLPYVFSLPGMESRTIDALEAVRNTTLREWTRSPLIGRELFLLLDRDGCSMLAGKRIRYDPVYGLRVEQEEEDDGESV